MFTIIIRSSEKLSKTSSRKRYLILLVRQSLPSSTAAHVVALDEAEVAHVEDGHQADGQGEGGVRPEDRRDEQGLEGGAQGADEEEAGVDGGDPEHLAEDAVEEEGDEEEAEEGEEGQGYTYPQVLQRLLVELQRLQHADHLLDDQLATEEEEGNEEEVQHVHHHQGPLLEGEEAGRGGGELGVQGGRVGAGAAAIFEHWDIIVSKQKLKKRESKTATAVAVGTVTAAAAETANEAFLNGKVVGKALKEG
ncbi:hypothetical protein TYRP_010305 [Tyrophagus putrescentiae]|nr:hypothetical protein TYRP_010305 [Tyrophagus putrescentiae]